MNDLRAISHLRDVIWDNTGQDWLVDVFDWDTIVISESVQATLSFELNLCTGVFPCSVRIRGRPRGNVIMTGKGSIICLADSFCSGISILSVALICIDQLGLKSSFKVQGSVLDVSNSSFTGCHSNVDGGVIQSYNKANVSISFCEFKNIHSKGYGGAVSAFGSNVAVLDSSFLNCSSQLGGGAIWSSGFEGCYGSTQASDSFLYVEFSRFLECKTIGSGGAILSTSTAVPPSSDSLDVRIHSTTFENCSAVLNGGALRISGAGVQAQTHFVEFSICSALSMGGAVSAGEFSSLSLFGSIFQNNVAYGLGGGALHVKKSSLLYYNTSIRNNLSPKGGGGVLFWQEYALPATTGCLTGMKSIKILCPLQHQNINPTYCVLGTCTLCSPGTFQAKVDSLECKLCMSGTYSNTSGSSACQKCPAGTYASGIGLENCGFCSVGRYSGEGAEACSDCVTGVVHETTYFSQHTLSDFAQCTPMVAPNGTVGRLPTTGKYMSNELMFWLVAPSNAANITLRFLTLDTVQGSDYVSVYACQNTMCLSNSSYSLGLFSGSSALSPSSVICPLGVMLIVWSSSLGSTKSGWSAEYTSNRKRTDDASTRFRHHNIYNPSSKAHVVVSHPKINERGSLEELRATRPVKQGDSLADEIIYTGPTFTSSEISSHSLHFAQLRSTAMSFSSETTPDDVCGINNSALFGSCIASGFYRLHATQLSLYVYSGVQLNLAVSKKDAYNQTILSDSSSLLKIVSTLNQSLEPDLSMVIVGSEVGELFKGEVTISFALKPSFTSFGFQDGFAILHGQTYLHLEGSDDQAPGITMLSEYLPVNLQAGFNVCPSGSILVPDEVGATNGSAMCTRCKAGTYSIRPLAGLSGGLPACFNCPIGSDCSKGGAEVLFKAGIWSDVDGEYILIACPAGHQLINSTTGSSKGIFSSSQQECRACNQGKYIINPNTDECQPCPPGIYHPYVSESCPQYLSLL